MTRLMPTALFMVVFATLAMAVPADAQGRSQQNRRDRQDRQWAAREQGVPPGQMPPANLCRVWYDNRPNGRQPSATSCRQAEIVAARDRNARVIYGENVYDDYRYRDSRDSRYPGRYPGDWERDDDDRGVYRVPGRNRAPRGGVDRYDPDVSRARYTTPAFQNGYRDGLNKGREDADDNDRYDASRHSWYRSATRGYEDEYGPRAAYQARYREGFEAGYDEGYRAYRR